MGEPCWYDELPCERFVEKLGYGICYVKSLNGKLRFVCRRFKLDSSVCIKESYVPKDLIPKLIER